MRDNNFINKFIPKTKEQIREENERKEFLAHYITNSSFYQKPLQQTVAVVDLFNEQTDLNIKLSDPLVFKDGKIAIDQVKLLDLLSKQNAIVIQNTLEKIRQSTVDRIAGYGGGGGVSIKYEDFAGNQTSLLKSVNDIIFTGDGVTLDREGKNIVVNIPGVSVLAGDPTIDFARESTTLDILQMINAMSDIVDDIQGVVIPTYYSGGIGGNTGDWTAI